MTLRSEVFKGWELGRWTQPVILFLFEEGAEGDFADEGAEGVILGFEF